MGYNKILDYNDIVPRKTAGWEKAGWTSERSQALRFEAIRRCLPRGATRVLDVGCNIGSFFSYVQAELPLLSYTGLDISCAAIEEAKRTFPEISFIRGDILTHDFKEVTYDIIIASGLLSSYRSLEPSELRKLIRAMAAIANEKLIFNSLLAAQNPESNRHFGISIEAMASEIGAITNSYNIYHSYLPSDATYELFINN